MPPIKPLPPESLCRRFDPGTLRFKTTDELPDLTAVLGQPRAMQALEFGIDIRHPGYHVYAAGPAGTGRHTIVRQFLDQRAPTEAVPSEWCYVNNFDEPHQPHALRLPPGRGVGLRDDMAQLMEDLRVAIPAAFESDEYRARRSEMEEELKERHEQAFKEVREEAARHDITLIRTPSGMAFAPLRAGKVLDPDDFGKLPEKEQQRIRTIIENLEGHLERVIHQLPQLRREGQTRLRALDRDMTLTAVGGLIAELKEKYSDLPEVLAYFDAVQQAVLDGSEDFRRSEEEPVRVFGMTVQPSGPSLRQFEVNVLIDHSDQHGAPVIYEDHPTYNALIGRIEHLAQMGALLTDFTLIKPGALHRANGGYLVIDAHKLLIQPFAYEGLKRCLRSGEIRPESLGQALSLISTVSIEPEPVPLKLKVVLVGERLLYYLLHEYDPEFRDLFKAFVDFETTVRRDAAADGLYAKLIGMIARKEGLAPLDQAAVASVIEHGGRLAEDVKKLTLRLRDLTDLLREADHWTRKQGRQVIAAADVERAIETRVYRMDRAREHVQEAIARGTLVIDVTGERVGQANGLSVINLGEFSFGHPTRITARVRVGKGEVVDIQREVELGGPIHSKGVLILAGFLGARYAQDQPLSIAASLVFEQTYAEVEGDSASCAELYALLSALADQPLRQSLAVTGSVNQQGEVQAIGGVNEKIEGFFDVCRERGLTGEQGVLIPAANVEHLMLRKDVVQAAAEGKFHVYPVRTVDEGIALLTGIAAGERDDQGAFPEGTINRRVEDALRALAETVRAFTAAVGGEDDT